MMNNFLFIISDIFVAFMETWHLWMFKFLTLLILGAAIGSGYLINYYIYRIPDYPDLDYGRWWGIGSKPREEDTSIRFFKIDFNDTMINDLKQRLRNRRPFTKPLDGIQSEYGMNTIYLRTIIDYWLFKYDFKKRAEILNRLPHYKTRIQGLDIHFIRVKPQSSLKQKGLQVYPLLLLHGWPSSSKEFIRVIPQLTTITPNINFGFLFEVVAPDLPGFGFSEGTSKPGLNPVQIAIMMRNLMRRLGFEQFFIQAGDWGSQVGTHMATLFPDEVLGFHTNMAISSMPGSVVKVFIGSLFPTWIDYQNPDRLYPLKKFFKYIMKESGYFHIQATKPDTIGVALSDSPIGLAAYLIEKMAVVSNKYQLNTPHGGIESLPRDDVLDTVTIMWANNNAVTSMRLYAEAMSSSATEIKTLHRIPTPVPTAALKFEHEVIYQPDWILVDKFPNLVRSISHDFGGHFAGIQSPHVLVYELFESVNIFLEFYNDDE